MSEEKQIKKEFSIAPDGDYKLRLAKYQIKDTKSGTGKYVNCVFEFAKKELGQEHGAVFENFNIENPNPKAVEVGKAKLTYYGMAIGLTEEEAKEIAEDPDKLEDTIGDPFVATLKTIDEGQYGKKSKIAKFMSK